MSHPMRSSHAFVTLTLGPPGPGRIGGVVQVHRECVWQNVLSDLLLPVAQHADLG